MHAGMKLGRLKSGPTPYLPALHRYTAKLPLPPPPADIKWSHGTDPNSWGMLLNDQLGDCAVAGPMHAIHAIQRWTDGTGEVPLDQDALANYQTLGGYVPGNPSTDQGLQLSLVLQHWQQQGLRWKGGTDQLIGFARVAPADAKAALHVFGPLILGNCLPLAAQSQFIWATPTDLTGDNAPSSWGDHCTTLLDWDHTDLLGCVTWGGLKTLTKGWLDAYVDEIWAIIHPAWVAAGHGPNGLLTDAILQDLHAL